MNSTNLFAKIKNKITKSGQPVIKGPADLLRLAEETAAGIDKITMPTHLPKKNLQAGNHRLHRSGSGEDFWQYRPYDISDSPSDIDWRQSAKGDSIFTKQKEWQTTQPITFWCASGASMDFTSNDDYLTKSSSAAILTLTLASLMANAGETVTLLGEDIKGGHSSATLQRMAAILWHNITTHKHTPLTGLPHLPHKKGSALILINDFINSASVLNYTLQELTRQNITIIQILDGAEIDFPYSGHTIFNSSDNQLSHDITQARAVQAGYRKRITQHLSSTQQTCEQNGAYYHLHRTDTPLNQTILSIWQDFKMKEEG